MLAWGETSSLLWAYRMRKGRKGHAGPIQIPKMPAMTPSFDVRTVLSVHSYSPSIARHSFKTRDTAIDWAILPAAKTPKYPHPPNRDRYRASKQESTSRQMALLHSSPESFTSVKTHHRAPSATHLIPKCPARAESCATPCVESTHRHIRCNETGATQRSLSWNASTSPQFEGLTDQLQR